MTSAESIDDTLRPPLTAAGMIIWLGSETMFFGGLFAAYFTLRANTSPWKPEDVELNALLGGIFTLILVASSYTMHRASHAARRHEPHGLVRWTAATVLLGSLFIANQAYEWSNLEFTISSHPFGSIFYLATGFHGLHVLGGMAAMALLIARVRLSGSAGRGWVDAVTYYWHFVDVVWVALFCVIFLLG